MDTTWLTVFQQIARTGSFTTAARELGYTQSAISRQIAALESELGAVLFERRARGVLLTEAGRHLLGHADAVLDRIRAARNDLSALRELTAGRLRIGSIPTAGVAVVPEAIARFRADHPRVALTHTDGLSRDLIEQVGRDDLDIAVVGGYPRQLRAESSVTLRHLMDESILVALPAGHRLAGRAELRLAELADETWIAGSTSPKETLISAALRQGFQPRIDYVVREWVAKQGFVAAGLGITLIPTLAIGSVRGDVVLTRLHPDDAPVRRVYAAHGTGALETAAVAAFRALLADAATGFAADAMAGRGPE